MAEFSARNGARCPYTKPESAPVQSGESRAPAAESERAERLGETIRRLRKEHGFTLKELAGLTGLSHPFLSQIERGQARPSMESLYQISEALGTNASWLLAGSENVREAAVVRASETTKVPAYEHGEIGGGRRVVVPETSPFQVIEFSGVPDKWRDYWTHDGYETVYVIEGTVELDLDGEVFSLNAGDSISYDTRLPHRLRAARPDEVKLLMVEVSPGITMTRLSE